MESLIPHMQPDDQGDRGGQVSRVGRWLRKGLLAILATGAMGAAAGASWWLWPPRAVDRFKSGAPPEWASLQRQRQIWERDGMRRQPAHEFRGLSHLGVTLPHAVLVSEDINFFGHGGVDPAALREVLLEWHQGKRLRGGSTISQQLAKILFLSPERSFWRKAREARLAWWLERRLGKIRILELYLNVVEFGPGVFGAEAASRRYYGVSAAVLDTGQAAGLAAAIPSPGRDNPATATPRWNFRRKLIMDRMDRSSWLARQIDGLSPSPSTNGDRHGSDGEPGLVNTGGYL